MSHTNESHRQVHTRIGMVDVPTAVAERIEELERFLVEVATCRKGCQECRTRASEHYGKVRSTRAAEAAAAEGAGT